MPLCCAAGAGEEIAEASAVAAVAVVVVAAVMEAADGLGEVDVG